MRKLVTISMLVAMSACTAGNGPFYVAAVRPINDATCGVVTTKEVFLSRFDLVDVRAEPNVWVTAQLSGGAEFADMTAQPPLIITGGRTVAPASRDRGVVQRIVLRYASRPAIPGLTAAVTDIIPVEGLINSAGGNELHMRVPLFGPNARAKLRDLAPSDEDSFQFSSSFEFQGVLDPSGAEWRAAPVSVPMTLVKSAFVCTDPVDQRVRTFAGGSRCVSAGVNQVGSTRVSAGSCCNNGGMIDLSTPGCDRLQ